MKHSVLQGVKAKVEEVKGSRLEERGKMVLRCCGNLVLQSCGHAVLKSKPKEEWG